MLFKEINQLFYKNQISGYTTVALNRLVKAGTKVGIILTNGLPWIEIDFPQDYEKACEDIYPKIKEIDYLH